MAPKYEVQDLPKVAPRCFNKKLISWFLYKQGLAAIIFGLSRWPFFQYNNNECNGVKSYDIGDH